LLHHHESLPVADACEIVRQAAIGLQFLHDKSLIHRDIKPSNLLVTATGKIKLLDLGIATRSSDHTQEQMPLVKPQGTLAYMAPEQITSPGRVDRSSDLYSLGCTLFKLLVGIAPTQPVPAITDLRSDVPRTVDRLMRRLLAPKQEDRPESLNEVIELLGAASRNSNLPSLVAPLCPEAAMTTHTDARPLSKSAPRVFNRRYALAALAAAGASTMLWPLIRTPGPALQTTRWRSLQLLNPNVLLSVGAPEKTSCEVLQDDRIQVVSDDLVLLQLGRPVVGLFGLQVGLQPQEQHSCGVFFNGQLKGADEDSESVENSKNAAFRFQSVELKRGQLEPNGDQTSHNPDRLAWNLWTASWQGDHLAAICTPLSEIAVKLSEAALAQQLVLTFGRQGMPEITFNGDKLHQTMWRFSQEGRKRQRLSPTQLPTAFLGQLGLISGKGSHTFERPQLSYLKETHDA